MSTIVKRITKGTTLTLLELDANINNLNTGKLEVSGGTLTGRPKLANQDIDIIEPKYPTIKPSLNLDFVSSRQLDPRVTFARNSTAAYYDGKTTAKAEENLLTYSQDFSNGIWVKGGGSGSIVVSNSTVAPDGTNTGTTYIAANGVGSNANVLWEGSIGSGSTTYTYSVYLKQGTFTSANFKICVFTGIAPSGFISQTAVDIDLTTGNLTNLSNGTFTSVVQTSVPANNGWYRLIVTGITPSNTYGIQGRITTGSTVTGDGTSGFYVWGAQLEQRSSVTAYTPTTTAPITNYIPVLKFAQPNVPRLDYDPITGKALGLLIEEQRVNLLSNSVGNGASWNVRSGTIVTTANAQVAPDGNITATQITKTATVDSVWQQPFTAIVGITYTASAYFEKTSYASVIELAIRLSFSGGDSSGYLSFDTLTAAYAIRSGALGAISIIDCGRYWRICITSSGTTTGTLHESDFIIRPIMGSVVGGFTATATGSCIFWGAQLEVGSFATSYIPTTTGAVTRVADQASMTGTNFSSWYNQSQGAMYCEGDTVVPQGTTIAENFWSLSDSLGTNYVAGQIYNQTNYLIIRVASVNSQIGLLGYTPSLALKSTYNLVDGAYTFCKNGVMSGVLAINKNGSYTQMGLGSVLATNYLNGHIRKLTYYPKALTSTELVALTS